MDLQASRAILLEVDSSGVISGKEEEIDATLLQRGDIVKVW